MRYLVTSALPYANGPIHFGHVIGAYLPADVYVRTLRQAGEEVLYVCGADEHGVAITIGAESEGEAYADYAARWRAEIKRTFDRFGIEFDVWSGTSVSPFHVELAQRFFRRLDENGYLLRREAEQLYCPKDERFLADRYVVGTCYVCGKPGARGDECPSCGTWLEVLCIVEPRCRICGTPPERRRTTHWYLDLPKLRDEHIGAWFAGKEWRANVRAFVGALLDDLQPRPITRDLSWGVPVPAEIAGEEEGKVIYVWFDAPIGYVSFTREWAAAAGEPDAWEAWWKSPDTRLVHFLGKDNIPFHCLIFPSMLWGVREGYVLPWAVPASEFYNLEGRKFSTSEGWTLPLDEFFERYDRDATRFHLLASAPESADAEWRWEDYQRSVNAALADTIGNLVTRVLRFCEKHAAGQIPALAPEHEAELDRAILVECGSVADPAESVLAFRFRRAAEELVANASVGNVFVDREAPWALRKHDPARMASVLATACEWIGLVARWMAPLMPAKAQAIWEMLGGEGSVAAEPAPGRPLAGRWRRLPARRALGAVLAPFAKLDDERIAAEVEALRRRARG
jgi:methionyl-tRNA synthetase